MTHCFLRHADRRIDGIFVSDNLGRISGAATAGRVLQRSLLYGSSFTMQGAVVLRDDAFRLLFGAAKGTWKIQSLR